MKISKSALVKYWNKDLKPKVLRESWGLVYALFMTAGLVGLVMGMGTLLVWLTSWFDAFRPYSDLGFPAHQFVAGGATLTLMLFLFVVVMFSYESYTKVRDLISRLEKYTEEEK